MKKVYGTKVRDRESVFVNLNTNGLDNDVQNATTCCVDYISVNAEENRRKRRLSRFSKQLSEMVKRATNLGGRENE